MTEHAASATPNEERWMTRAGRRFLTVGVLVWIWSALTVFAPLWAPLAFVADLLPGRRAALRFLSFLWVFACYELAGVAASFWMWLRARVRTPTPDEWLRASYELQAWWAAGLLAAVRRIYGVRFEVEGADKAGPGPIVLLVRHVSVGDTLLPAVFAANSNLRFRYVLKRDLLWDPCLDIVGNRLPNAFVRRDGLGSGDDITRVEALARAAGAGEGVLIYPEGTRFSARKRSRLIRRLADKGDDATRALAEELQTVLPPRPGGTLAALRGLPQADVVICAHSGFEGIATVGDMWRAVLVGCTVRVRFTRVPRAEIPTDERAQVAWLNDAWRDVDRWVTRGQATPAEGRAQPLVWQEDAS